MTMATNGNDDIIHDGPVDDAVVRQWAYNENMWLSEQDEDLLLWHEDYLPVLIELAGQPACTKAGYIFDILQNFIREKLTRHPAPLGLFDNTIELAKHSEEAHLRRWAEHLQRQAALKKQSGPVDRQRAQEIGTIILQSYWQPEIEVAVTDENALWYIRCPSARPKSLYIHKQTGAFSGYSHDLESHP